MKEARKKYDVSALLPENSDQRVFDYLDQLGVTYGLLSARRDPNVSTNFFQTVRAHLDWVRDERTLVKEITKDRDLGDTVLHVDLGFWASFLPLFRLSMKAKVFATIHTALPEVGRWRTIIWKLKGAILGRTRNFNLLASNQDAKKSVTRYFPSERTASIKVAYSGFNVDEIEGVRNLSSDQDSLRKKFDLPIDRTLIFSVGQFIERKGCWVVLDALKSLRSQNIFFVWLGTSAPDEQTRKKIDGYELTDIFRLMTAADIGHTRNDLLGLLNIADIFVLASLEEGLPIALVEAMALGKPCVATRINAIPEAIENKVNGLLVKPGNAAELADAIDLLLSDPDLREQIGDNARDTAFDGFQSRIGAEITSAAYAEALGK